MADPPIKKKRGPYRTHIADEIRVGECSIPNAIFEAYESEIKISNEDTRAEFGDSGQGMNEEPAMTSNLTASILLPCKETESAVCDDCTEESRSLKNLDDDKAMNSEVWSYFKADYKTDADDDLTVDDVFHAIENDDDLEVDELEDEWCLLDDDFEEKTEDVGTDALDDDFLSLYPGSCVTVGAFMLLLALFTTKFNITGDGIQQLLNIIAFALPNGHRLCTSLHSFKKIFTNLRIPLVKHYYCSHCLCSIGDTNLQTCSNQACKKPLQKERHYFLEVPLLSQIQNLLTQDGFYEKLQHRFKREHTAGTYEDIYDGSLYKSYVTNGYLQSPDNISFLFNTDGAAVFKSSNVSIWPIYLAINELPYKQRMKKENMLLAGLWFGNEKSLMSTFLKPFLQSMKQLEQGIQCVSPERGQFVLKGYLLAGTADLPARCLLCNSMQYNGAYSCWKCKQKGDTAKVGKGHTHVFPYSANSPKGPSRTRACVIEDAKKVMENKENRKKTVSENGIKGPSWLLLFPNFDIIQGIAIDYMHGVLLGVQKLLIRLWFAKEFSSKVFSCHAFLQKVDKRLQSIKPTSCITRLPRSIEKDLKYWKASEYRSFLLYYGVPVLWGVLDNQRFFHYLNFVNAIHILLTKSTTDTDIERAENMLLQFCRNFARLYDLSYMTLNLHQLMHLPDSVRQLGPLYTHSCFSFEDKNGIVLKWIRGTQNIDNQIVTGISFIQKLPELKAKCIEKGSVSEKLYEAIDCPCTLKRSQKLNSRTYISGAVQLKQLSQEEFSALSDYLGVCPLSHSFKCFKRLELHDYLIYGLDYTRMSKRNNSTIQSPWGSGTE